MMMMMMTMMTMMAYLGQSREKGFNLGPRLQAREVPLWGDAVIHVNHIARLELGGLST
jgi:hypothetical protein